MKPLLIGEAPARAMRNGRAMDSEAGDRLAKLGGFDSCSKMLDYFDVLNLFPEPMEECSWKKGDRFPLTEARRHAVEVFGQLLFSPQEPPPFVVLLGRRVAKAFGMQQWPFLRWFHLCELGTYSTPARGWPTEPLLDCLSYPKGKRVIIEKYGALAPVVAVLPHPSGANRWYDDKRNWRKAAGFVRCLAAQRRMP